MLSTATRERERESGVSRQPSRPSVRREREDSAAQRDAAARCGEVPGRFAEQRSVFGLREPMAQTPIREIRVTPQSGLCGPVEGVLVECIPPARWFR